MQRGLDLNPKQQIYGERPLKTHQIERSIRGKIGAIFLRFSIFGGKEKFVENPWQPKAADTNMLRVHLVGGPIFKDFDLESGGIGGERRGK